ncbi:hypothetical protein [Candidatus Enterococcus willemsii]|uniref:Uncharacterized protein n=1 Tax=Candidatus Enterococcus willemsii TaxID=1857215 RepID=A0ABQ6YVX7_9ENTE|nr:hypothetical protein [Enterococcus sp. CU12B]KAF1301495.1 hypothetical protein BAU17_06120 [Enterococcus sp. CU12B]
MQIYLKRATGFFGMASPLTVSINGEKQTMISNNQEKQLIVPKRAILQVSFFWLKSNQIELTEANAGQRFVVTMNPFILQAYICFFLLTSLFGFVLNQVVGLLICLVAYACLLPYVMKKVYVIKEDTYG